jgi:hypothetical protein
VEESRELGRWSHDATHHHTKFVVGCTASALTMEESIPHCPESHRTRGVVPLAVTPVAVYELKRVDSDFFAAE